MPGPENQRRESGRCGPFQGMRGMSALSAAFIRGFLQNMIQEMRRRQLSCGTILNGFLAIRMAAGDDGGCMAACRLMGPQVALMEKRDI